uniref:Uncharacterized protein n=1 Tax=Panagrolaimus sp. PS1159 TaxID=55785 RepID=A0AC35GLQ8_9BILA
MKKEMKEVEKLLEQLKDDNHTEEQSARLRELVTRTAAGKASVKVAQNAIGKIDSMLNTHAQMYDSVADRLINGKIFMAEKTRNIEDMRDIVNKALGQFKADCEKITDRRAKLQTTHEKLVTKTEQAKALIVKKQAKADSTLKAKQERLEKQAKLKEQYNNLMKESEKQRQRWEMKLEFAAADVEKCQ